MSLSDTAEYWWKDHTYYGYSGPTFYHHPNKLYSHYNPQSGNIKTTPYVNDINCHECKSKIESGEFSKDELRLEDSPETFYMSNSEKKRFNKQKRFEEQYGRCQCGCSWQIRRNNVTQKEFLGCLNYPNCKKTKSI